MDVTDTYVWATTLYDSLSKISAVYSTSMPVADPGFPDGAPAPESNAPIYYFDQGYKLREIEKNFGPGSVRL